MSHTMIFILIDLALAWCLKNDNVHCVLLGATSAEQLYENINALNVDLLSLKIIDLEFFLLFFRSLIN